MRQKYIDSLRGLCMLLVIYSHLVEFCLPNYYSDLNLVFMTFRMPMFFFISGFVSYKALELWTPLHYKSAIRKKIEGQLLPSFIILFVFCVIMDYNYLLGVTSEIKYGYWFTFVSFGVYAIWATICLMISKYKSLYLVVGGVFVVLMMGFHHYTIASNNLIVTTFSLDSITLYFPFFIYGTIAKRYVKQFHQLLNHPYLFLIVVVIAFLPHFNHIRTFVRIARVVCLYQVFYHYKDSIGMNYLNKSLGYIGKHTLEIYFIHYFLLFGLPHVAAILIDVSFTEMPIKGCTSFLEFLILMPLTIVIAYTCILIKKIIDCVPVVSRLCFGPTKN